MAFEVKKNRKQRRLEEKLLRKEEKKQKKETSTHIQEMFAKALSLHETKTPEEILQFYNSKLNSQATPLEELELYGMSAIEFNYFEVGIALLEKALLLLPDSLEVLYYLGSTYFKMQKLDKALLKLEKIMQLEPTHLPCHILLASIHLEKGELDKTIDYCQKGLVLERESDEILTIIGEAFLRKKDYVQAISALKQSYIVNPIDTRNLSLLFISLSQGKDELNLNEIYPFDQLIKTYRPECPEGLNDKAEFLDSVAKLILGHPYLKDSPEGFSTQNGSQTIGDLLTTTNHPLLEVIEHQIHLAVKNHVTALLLPEKHPLVLGAPKEYRIASWAVQLRNEGHQTSHVHLDGWLSGVYYLKVPKEITENKESHAGSLRFGEWRDDFECSDYFQTLSIKPEQGTIVTFPSYIWHKTIPFNSEEDRICIAFDIIPV